MSPFVGRGPRGGRMRRAFEAKTHSPPRWIDFFLTALVVTTSIALIALIVAMLVLGGCDLT